MRTRGRQRRRLVDGLRSPSGSVEVATASESARTAGEAAQRVCEGSPGTIVRSRDPDPARRLRLAGQCCRGGSCDRHARAEVRSRRIARPLRNPGAVALSAGRARRLASSARERRPCVLAARPGSTRSVTHACHLAAPAAARQATEIEMSSFERSRRRRGRVLAVDDHATVPGCAARRRWRYRRARSGRRSAVGRRSHPGCWGAEARHGANGRADARPGWNRRRQADQGVPAVDAHGPYLDGASRRASP